MTATAEEREAMLTAMQETSSAFYRCATRIGCHPFIEFTGLMNEYIKICRQAHAAGLDFTQASAHSGIALPMQTFEAEYLGEKLGCIYGPSLQSRDNLAAFMAAAGLGKE
jgi:hypothetical protein